MVTINNFIRNNRSLKMYSFEFNSSGEYFKDLTSTFIDFHVVVKKSNNEKPSASEGLFFESMCCTICFEKSMST